MPSIQDVFKAFAKEVRAQLAAHDLLKGRVEFGFTASGYPAHGELVVKFFIREGYGTDVEAFDPNEAVKEFLRRRGFDTTHQPLLITTSGTETLPANADE